MDEPVTVSSAEPGGPSPLTLEDRLAVLLGRPVTCDFEVIRWRGADPAVIRNTPFLRDGTPMPTLYWMCDAPLRSAISRLESNGGVHAAEATIPAADIAATHAAYAEARDRMIAPDHLGPRPSGGVGGTRIGVKCLHAHVAYALAGGDDPVGQWTLAQLDAEVLEGLR